MSNKNILKSSLILILIYLSFNILFLGCAFLNYLNIIPSSTIDLLIKISFLLLFILLFIIPYIFIMFIVMIIRQIIEKKEKLTHHIISFAFIIIFASITFILEGIAAFGPTAYIDINQNIDKSSGKIPSQIENILPENSYISKIYIEKLFPNDYQLTINYQEEGKDKKKFVSITNENIEPYLSISKSTLPFNLTILLSLSLITLIGDIITLRSLKKDCCTN